VNTPWRPVNSEGRPLLRITAFHGYQNRVSPESLPNAALSAAVNVQFDNANRLVMPRQGYAKVINGDCHSLFAGRNGVFYVDGVDLKEQSLGTLATIGNTPCYFTEVLDVVYFANGTVQGKIKNGQILPWGIARPPRQPDCATTTFGGLFAGEYRVCVTWIGVDGEESGTGMGKRILVAEGGGIRAFNFPEAPDAVNHFAVYVSSVNSKDMYLVGEYPIGTTEVFIDATLRTVPLDTQFGYAPLPVGKITAHRGRIYYPRGNKLYWTSTRRYGLQFAKSFWQFDSDITVVFSENTVLYVGTRNRIYRVGNIDGEESPMLEVVKEYGAVADTECKDPIDGTYAYTNRGFVKATQDGIIELHNDKTALPIYEHGTTTVVEQNGMKYLIGAFQGQTPNPLARL
jgi:hypothetical protein